MKVAVLLISLLVGVCSCANQTETHVHRRSFPGFPTLPPLPSLSDIFFGVKDDVENGISNVKEDIVRPLKGHHKPMRGYRPYPPYKPMGYHKPGYEMDYYKPAYEMDYQKPGYEMEYQKPSGYGKPGYEYGKPGYETEYYKPGGYGKPYPKPYKPTLPPFRVEIVIPTPAFTPAPYTAPAPAYTPAPFLAPAPYSPPPPAPYSMPPPPKPSYAPMPQPSSGYRSGEDPVKMTF